MVECYLGEIRLFPTAWAPQGWLRCEGQTLQISQYQALYSLIGTQFGGNGTSTFMLPDLRSRAIVGNGQLHYPNGITGNTYAVGQYGGVEAVTLTSANLPSHDHYLIADATAAQSANAGENYFATVDTTGGAHALYAPAGAGATVTLAGGVVSSVGSGGPHTNEQPYLTMTYCICTSGVYPPRP